MARTFGIPVLVLLVGLALLPRGSAGDAPAAGLKLGMPENMFRDVQPATVKAISRPFRALFERQTGLTGDVELVCDAETLANKLKEQKLHLGVFSGFEFAQIRARHPDLRPLVVSIPHGRTCQAYIVVHKDSKAEKLADLAGEQLVMPRGLKAHCIAFLEKAKRDLPATVASPTPKPTQTTEEVLNSIVEGTTTAALVDVGAFTAYQNLQPGATQFLRVLCKSETFPLSVLTYRKGTLDEQTLNRVKTGLIATNKTAQGKPLLMLWNLHGFEEVPADYEEQLDNIKKAYPTAIPASFLRPSK